MTANEQAARLGPAPARALPVAHGVEKKGRSRLFAFVAVGCALAGAGAYYWEKKMRPAAAPASPRLVRPEIREINSSITATGVVRLRTGAEVRVGTQISGIVTKLNVTVGAHIRKDEVIAEIESRGLEARIAQAHSQIDVDEAAVDKTLRDLERSRQLLEARLIPRQQTEDLEADLRSARARLAKSKSDLAVVESDLPYLTIRAPIAGTVASVSTQQGETVAASFNAPTFVTIIEDNALELVAMIDETDIGGVRPSNAVTFTTETFPAREFKGVVERIAPKATIVSGVVDYETGIAIQTGASVLKPDMTANVTITTARRRALMIPAEAIRQEGSRKFVYLERNGAPERREFSAGPRHDSWYEVKSGLNADDRILAGDLPSTQGSPR